MFCSDICFGEWRRRDSKIYTAFEFICLTGPIMTEQFYFRLQIFEIAWAYLLCVFSVAFSYFGIIKKNIVSCVIAILAMVWIFCTYQIFVVLYVVCAVTCFVLLYQRWPIIEQRYNAPYWKIVAGLIILFAIAFVTNSVITNLFVE